VRFRTGVRGMIVYGWGRGSKRLGEGFIGRCYHCSNQRRFVVVESSQRFTLYWIPVAKWNRHYFYICPVCNHGIELPNRELAGRILDGAMLSPSSPSAQLFEDIKRAFRGEDVSRTTGASSPDSNQQSAGFDATSAQPERTTARGESSFQGNAESVASERRPAAPEGKPSANVVDPVIKKVDGTSSYVTLQEHRRRGWKEIAGCDLSGLVFTGDSFRGINLEGVRFDGSSFEQCDFRGARFVNVSAVRCDFDNADFSETVFEGANFSHSSLRGVKCCRIIEGNKAVSATIKGVCFTHSNLSGSMFSVLTTSKPVRGIGCTIHKCDFSDANLSLCRLSDCLIQETRFEKATLYGSILDRSRLEGLDFTRASVVNISVESAIVSESTKFPEGLRIPDSVIKVDLLAKNESKNSNSPSNASLIPATLVDSGNGPVSQGVLTVGAEQSSRDSFFGVFALMLLSFVFVVILIAISNHGPAEKLTTRTTPNAEKLGHEGPDASDVPDIGNPASNPIPRLNNQVIDIAPLASEAKQPGISTNGFPTPSNDRYSAAAGDSDNDGAVNRELLRKNQNNQTPELALRNSKDERARLQDAERERQKVGQSRFTHPPQSTASQNTSSDHQVKKVGLTEKKLATPDSATDSKNSRSLRNANELYSKGKYSEAIEVYETLIQSNSDVLDAKYHLARLLATCRESQFRNGPRSLQLAMEVYHQSRLKDSNWKVTSVVSAAYAETGDFESASYWLRLAERTGSSQRAMFDQMREQYRQKKAVRW
jgi:uncharacterized protein YjbI with pentapeptide repeats